MKQLPYRIHKLAPQNLRKDHWAPLLQCLVPNEKEALRIQNQVLRFRQMRQSNPPTLDDLKLTVAQRRQKEQNQVATSIADLAQTLHNFDNVPAHIRWRNEHDQGFAQSWPASVTHSAFPKNRDAERLNKPFGEEKSKQSSVAA